MKWRVRNIFDKSQFQITVKSREVAKFRNAAIKTYLTVIRKRKYIQ